MNGVCEAVRTHFEATASLHILEHVASRGVFHGNGQVIRSEEDFFELDDMRVAEITVADNLPLDMLRDFVTPLHRQRMVLRRPLQCLLYCHQNAA